MLINLLHKSLQWLERAEHTEGMITDLTPVQKAALLARIDEYDATLAAAGTAVIEAIRATEPIEDEEIS